MRGERPLRSYSYRSSALVDPTESSHGEGRPFEHKQRSGAELSDTRNEEIRMVDRRHRHQPKSALDVGCETRARGDDARRAAHRVVARYVGARRGSRAKGRAAHDGVGRPQNGDLVEARGRNGQPLIITGPLVAPWRRGVE
jgi:hypothetical protein